MTTTDFTHPAFPTLTRISVAETLLQGSPEHAAMTPGSIDFRWNGEDQQLPE